jgi:hypothetical protein
VDGKINDTLIGHGSKENPTMILNNTDLINNGDVIYYIGKNQIGE